MPDGSARHHSPRIAFYLPNLCFGGAERVTVNLAGYLAARGWDVRVVLNAVKGDLLKQLPAAVQVHGMGAGRAVGALIPLARYLRRHRPDVLVAAEAHVSVSALLARRLAGVDVPTVVAEHSVLSTTISGSWRSRTLGWLIRTTYPMADAVVAVSHGAADDLHGVARLNARPEVIYNPVLSAADIGAEQQPPDDSWFAAGSPPVFVAAGRLRWIKGFDTLVEAFALVRAHMDARLVILGKGLMRRQLEDRIRVLGLDDAVRLPGFASEPMRYFQGAAAVVVPSRQESFGNVLVEAMACGRPVISTNCPGPREVLDNGHYGTLVPIDDAPALAAAMMKAAHQPVDAEVLKRRAGEYTVERCGQHWLRLLEAAIASAHPAGMPAHGSGGFS